MKLPRLLIALLIPFLMISGFPSTAGDASEKPEEILLKVGKAIDPEGKRDSINSETIYSDIKTIDGDIGKLTVTRKKPGLIRIEAKTDKDVMVRAFDGKNAWEFDSKNGIRKLDAAETGVLKFQAVFPSFLFKGKDIFSSIKYEGEAEAAGIKCFKLSCTPLQEFGMKPMTVFIDTKTFFIVKTEQTHVTKAGDIDIKTVYDDYSDFDGLFFPTSMVSEVGGGIRELEVTDIKFNEIIPLSDFQEPVKLENK